MGAALHAAILFGRCCPRTKSPPPDEAAPPPVRRYRKALPAGMVVGANVWVRASQSSPWRRAKVYSIESAGIEHHVRVWHPPHKPDFRLRPIVWGSPNLQLNR